MFVVYDYTQILASYTISWEHKLVKIPPPILLLALICNLYQ